MSNELIVRCGLAAFVVGMTLLPSCAIAAAQPLSAEQVAAQAARESAEEAEAEQARKEAVYHHAELIAVVDGYKVYEIRGGYHLVYITIPCGRTSWTTEERSGKTSHLVRHEMPSVECKP